MKMQIKAPKNSNKSDRTQGTQRGNNRRDGGLTSASQSFEKPEGEDHHEAGRIKAYAAQSASSPLGSFAIRRREVSDQDVQINILYCGVFHSDLHMVRNEWHQTVYPCVPGHEIVGQIVKVGRELKNSKRATWLPSVAWWIPAALVQVAVQDWSSIVNAVRSSPTAVRISILWE